MQYFGQLVIGPSGSGKSTYCHVVQEMAETLRRNVFVVNLDPAAEYLPYQPLLDIRELITLDDVMEEYKLGPNGGLVYCMEYLVENIQWLQEQLGTIAPNDYLLFDCPGQLELYSHLDVMASLGRRLVQEGFSLVSVCLLDCTFVTDQMKYISGCLAALSFVVSLGLPSLTLLSKCDLYPDRRHLRSLVGEQALSSSEESDDEEEQRAAVPRKKDPAHLAFSAWTDEEETTDGLTAKKLDAKLSAPAKTAKALLRFSDDDGSFAAKHAELRQKFTEIVALEG